MKKILILICFLTLKAPSIFATDEDSLVNYYFCENKESINIQPFTFSLDQNIGRDDFCSSAFSYKGDRAAVVAGEAIHFFSIPKTSKPEVGECGSVVVLEPNISEVENSRPMISFNSSGACLVFLDNKYPFQLFDEKGDAIGDNTLTFAQQYIKDACKLTLFAPCTDPKELQMVGCYSNENDKKDLLFRAPNVHPPTQLSGAGKTKGISLSPDGTLLAAIGYDHVNIWTMP